MEDVFSVLQTLLKLNQADNFLVPHMVGNLCGIVCSNRLLAPLPQFSALRLIVNLFAKMLFTHR